MRRFASTTDLADASGELLGVSSWTELSERDLQEFGRLTGDEHWIHVDPVRAAAESPFGSVIAPGFLTLALLTGLHHECYSVDSARRQLNYGLDRVRFIRALLPGTRFRLELTLTDVEPVPSGARVHLDCRLVTEAGDPVLAASWLNLVIEKEESQ